MTHLRRVLMLAVCWTAIGAGSNEAAADITPLDIQFKREGVRRLVFDENQAIHLSSLRPTEIINLGTQHPVVSGLNAETEYTVDAGRLRATAGQPVESALWIGGFNPFATYDVSFPQSASQSGDAGIEFASPDNQNRISIVARFVEGQCRSLHWSVRIDGVRRQMETIDLREPIRGPFKLRIQVLGTGLNIYVVENGINRVVSIHEFSHHIDLRRKEHIRSFDFRLLTRLQAGEEIAVKSVEAALTTGVGQADVCAITYEDGAPYLDQGRLWFTMSVRGRRLPHPLQGVFSMNPSVFDVRFEGIIVFDRDDGLLRNEIASHIFYDRRGQEWRGLTVGFSAAGDPEKNIPKQLWAVSSERDPRFGFSIMAAKDVEMPGAAEDPHVIYDADARKWRVLVCTRGGPGFPATLYESDRWDGPYKIIAGPAEVNGTGCLLQKIGSRYYAMFGSKDRKFYVYSYPELKPLGHLDMIQPPWRDGENTRCWPNVIPLPDGYPAPYIALTMDRANYPGLKGWTYGALYLYHGHPKAGAGRERYEYARTAD